MGNCSPHQRAPERGHGKMHVQKVRLLKPNSASEPFYLQTILLPRSHRALCRESTTASLGPKEGSCGKTTVSRRATVGTAHMLPSPILPPPQHLAPLTSPLYPLSSSLPLTQDLILYHLSRLIQRKHFFLHFTDETLRRVLNTPSLSLD